MGGAGARGELPSARRGAGARGERFSPLEAAVSRTAVDKPCTEVV